MFVPWVGNLLSKSRVLYGESHHAKTQPRATFSHLTQRKTDALRKTRRSLADAPTLQVVLILVLERHLHSL